MLLLLLPLVLVMMRLYAVAAPRHWQRRWEHISLCQSRSQRRGAARAEPIKLCGSLLTDGVQLGRAERTEVERVRRKSRLLTRRPLDGALAPS